MNLERHQQLKLINKSYDIKDNKSCCQLFNWFKSDTYNRQYTVCAKCIVGYNFSNYELKVERWF